ncbi:MAG: type II secretion system protein GspN [Bdellovibrionales bacterium]|nr:type II secretion system protein GspN [Bdellovibrionales bacterium]
MAELTSTETTGVIIEEAPKKSRLSGFLWAGFFFVCLFLFTLIKIPESRIKNYIQGMIASQLNPRGITLVAQSSELSFIFGLGYKMKGVSLRLPPPEPEIRIDSIEVSPSLFSALTGKLGGDVKIEAGDGSMKAKFLAKGLFPADPTGKIDASTSFRFKNFNLGRLGILGALTGFKAGATLEGEGALSGNLSDPSSFDGFVKLGLTKVQIDSQAIPTPIGSTSIPALRMGQGTIDVKFEKGRAMIQQFQLGKAGSADDLAASVSGDLALGKRWDSSNITAKVVFSVAEPIAKQFSLDALLKEAKKPDGSFSYQLSGAILRPVMTPQP